MERRPNSTPMQLLYLTTVVASRRSARRRHVPGALHYSNALPTSDAGLVAGS